MQGARSTIYPLVVLALLLSICTAEHGDHGGHDHGGGGGGHDHGGHDHGGHDHHHHDHGHHHHGWGDHSDHDHGGNGGGNDLQWYNRGGGRGGGLLGLLGLGGYNGYSGNYQYQRGASACSGQLIDYVGSMPRYYCNCGAYGINYQYYGCQPMAG